MRTLSLAAWLVFVGTAAAQPTTEPTEEAPDPAEEEARILFDHGRELAEERRFAEAVEAFERSLERHARPSTRFNLALCLFALGRHVETLDVLERYVAEAPPEEAEGVIEARRMMALARGRLATLAVETVPADASVTIDGDTVSDARELRLDPGVHVVRVAALDHATHVMRLELGAGERRRELVRLESTRSPALLSLSVDRPATITLDGVVIDAVRDERLEPGPHRLVVEAPGASWTRDLTLESGQHHEIDLALPPEPPPPAEWWQKPWPWLAAGVVVVGGILAAVLLTGRTGEPTGGNTGVVLEGGSAGPTGARIVP